MVPAAVDATIQRSNQSTQRKPPPGMTSKTRPEGNLYNKARQDQQQHRFRAKSVPGFPDGEVGSLPGADAEGRKGHPMVRAILPAVCPDPALSPRRFGGKVI